MSGSSASTSNGEERYIEEEDDEKNALGTDPAPEQSVRQQPDIPTFTRNFELLDLSVSDPFVDKSRIETYLLWVSWVHSSATPMHVKLFYEEFLPRTIKLLLHSRITYEEHQAEVVHRFICDLAKTALSRCLHSPKDIPPALVDCMLQVLNPCSPFYLINQPSPTAPLSLTLHSQALDDLKVGDRVFLVEEKTWGEIVQFSPTETEALVKCHNGTEKWFSKDASSFATSSVLEAEKDFKALENTLIREGLLCDAKMNQCWYQACIVSCGAEYCQVHFLGFPPSANRDVPHNELAVFNQYSFGRRGTVGAIHPSLMDDDHVEAALMFTDFLEDDEEEDRRRRKKKKERTICARRSKPSSVYFIETVEFLGGDLIDLLWHALESNLRLSVFGFNLLLPYFIESFTLAITDKCLSRLLHSIQALNKLEIRNNMPKQVLFGAVSLANRLTLKVHHRTQQQYPVERIRLIFCEKLIESEMILKRVDGLNFLNDILQEARHSHNLILENDCYRRERCFPPNLILEFVKQKPDYLRSLFDPNSGHVELIKRSSPLIEFLCSHLLFRDADFGSIWTAITRSDDVEISSSSFSILIACCTWLPRECFQHRWHELQLDKPAHVELLQTLLTSSPELATPAFDLLWKEDSLLSCTALKLALVKAVRHDGWEAELRLQVLRRCLDEFSSKVLGLIRACVESFEVESERVGVVTWLCHELRLMDKLSMLNETSKLDFLSFILVCQPPSVLDYATIELLWEQFPTGKSREEFFHWLQKICFEVRNPKPQQISLTEDTLLQVFHRIQLSKSEFQSSFAFRVFLSCFESVNALQSRMVKQPNGWDIHYDHLMGLDTLWEIALGTKSSDAVSELACRYVSTLQKRESDDVYWSNLEKKLLRLQRSFPSPRSCSMLAILLKDCEAELSQAIRGADESMWDAFRAHDTYGPFGSPVKLVISTSLPASNSSSGVKKQLEVELRANASVGNLRRQIAAQVSVDDCLDLRLFAGGSELQPKCDHRSVFQATPLSTHILVVRRVNALEERQRVFGSFDAEVSLSPFSRLLLEQVQGVSQEHVSLLSLLPVSRASKDEARFHFDHFSVPAILVYRLRILMDGLYFSSVMRQEMISHEHFCGRLQALVVNLYPLASSDDSAHQALVLCLSIIRDILKACGLPNLLQEDPVVEKRWPKSEFSVFPGEVRAVALEELDLALLQHIVVSEILPLAQRNEMTTVSFEVWFHVLMVAREDLFEGSISPLKSLISTKGHDAELCQGLHQLCVHLPQKYAQVILQSCLEVLPSSSVALMDLIKQHIDLLPCQPTLKILLQKLRDMPSQESFPHPCVESYSHETDYALTGILVLIEHIVLMSPLESEQVTMDLGQFDAVADCVLSPGPCRCELLSSREVAFKTLLTICQRFPLSGDLWFSKRFQQAFPPQVTHAITIKEWNLDPCKNLRSPHGFCGIENLGATCYMNALFQQLWAIPGVRQGFETLSLASPQENEEEGGIHVAILLLQRFFCQLSESVKRTCSLSDFVRVFKDEDGFPVNVIMQQDAQEFFERVCDQVDDFLVKQEKTRVFQPCLGVRIASVLVCLDDASKAAREDAGTTEWCLKVQFGNNEHTLEELLQRYVQGEVLHGFTWADNGPPMRTLKKVVIKALPHTLAIHLGRFHMNWESQVCEKSNQRLEFPLELNMRRYCQEGLQEDDDYFQYRLVGVLVHDGARLNSGHYYSFVQSRVHGSNTFGKWFSFNDSMVDAFDISRDLEEACFGGVNPKTKSLRTHCAYMLFYERDSAGVSSTTRSTRAPQDFEAHMLACRLFDPNLLHFLSCLLEQTEEVGEGHQAIKRLKSDSSDLFEVLIDPFLTSNLCVAARSVMVSALYPRFVESISSSLRKTPSRASNFLQRVTSQDVLLLLVDAPNFRVGLNFASLLGVAIQVCTEEEVAVTFISSVFFTTQVVDYVLSKKHDNSFWYALNLMVDARPSWLSAPLLAMHLVPRVFAGITQHPHLSWNCALSAGLTVSTGSSALITTNKEAQLHAWIRSIPFMESHTLDEFVTWLQQEFPHGNGQVMVARLLAKQASSLPEVEKLTLFYEVVSKLNISQVFFLDDKVGFFRLALQHKQPLFCFYAIAEFVERVAKQGDFEDMLDAMEKWKPSLVEYLNNDELALNLMDPLDVNRLVECLDLLMELESLSVQDVDSESSILSEREEDRE